MDEACWTLLELKLQEISTFQKQTLLQLGRRIVPTLTMEDLLQPNDYEELENNPHFRYEEGVLAGIDTALMALYALKKDLEIMR